MDERLDSLPQSLEGSLRISQMMPSSMCITTKFNIHQIKRTKFRHEECEFIMLEATFKNYKPVHRISGFGRLENSHKSCLDETNVVSTK